MHSIQEIAKKSTLNDFLSRLMSFSHVESSILITKISPTSILISYSESTGFFTPGVEFSSNSIKQVQRYRSKPKQVWKSHRHAIIICPGKAKFKESLSPDEIGKSLLPHGNICCIIKLTRIFF